MKITKEEQKILDKVERRSYSILSKYLFKKDFLNASEELQVKMVIEDSKYYDLKINPSKDFYLRCLNIFTLYKINKDWLNDEDFVIKAIEKDTRIFSYIEDREVIPESFIKAYLNNTYACTSILKKEFMTEDLYKFALSFNGKRIFDIPMEKRTHEMYNIAVINDPYLIRYKIPIRFKTKAFCLIAVKSNPCNLEYVLESMSTNTSKKIELLNKVGYTGYPPFTKEDYKEICYEAVKRNPDCYKFIVEDYLP